MLKTLGWCFGIGLFLSLAEPTQERVERQRTHSVYPERQGGRRSQNTESTERFFSIVDVCGVLAESENPQTYWRVLKNRLKKEGNETVTNCNALKMRAADGKMRLTDVADTKQLFRLIQSIPSPKAEPFKQWMAQVAAQRIDQMQDPELNFEQAYADYRRLGHSVISPAKAADYLPPVEDVEALPERD